MNKTDTLIIGQGIAGSLRAHLLHQLNVSFIVIDPGYANTSSRIAAGMFTPVTGKRKTIQPRVQEQIELAISTYRSIEQTLNISILHQQNIYQVFHSIAEQNEFSDRAAEASFRNFILPNPERVAHIKDEAGACEITHSGWVDCDTWINGVADWLNKRGAFIKGQFVYQDLHIGKITMEYQGIVCNNIIFCEGYQAIHNPFFQDEHIIPCKGNVLTIQFDNLTCERIIKKNGLYLVPSGNNFKAGSTYQWNNATTAPDDDSADILRTKLDDMLADKYIVLDHQAAIRPTTQNREVIARQHATHKGMFILNGLGTRGILQGPWWARRIIEQMRETS